MNSLQCVERSLVPKAKISSNTHVQLLQWLHGKQQQQNRVAAPNRDSPDPILWTKIRIRHPKKPSYGPEQIRNQFDELDESEPKKKLQIRI